MIEIANAITTLAREAWVSIAGIVAVALTLGLIARFLQGAGGALVGGGNLVAAALSGMAGLFAIGLTAFLAVPEIARAGYQAAANAGATCGWLHPVLSDLATASAMLIGAIGALRMMAALLEGAAGAMVGGSASMGRAMIAVVDALVGMLVASIALPMVQRLLMC